MHLLIGSIDCKHITHPHCQPVCPISAAVLKHKKNGNTWKLLNLIKWYAIEKISEPLLILATKSRGSRSAVLLRSLV